jgi:hypothetical protein
MTLSEVKRLLNDVRVPAWAVGFSDDGGEGLRLIYENHRWLTYYSERGQRWDVKFFMDESNACLDLCGRLFTDRVVLQELAKL